MTNINKDFTNLEYCFNVAGSIPVVNFVSSSLRAVVAKAQIIAGAVMGVIGLVGHTFSDNSKYTNLAKFGGTHVVHGVANAARAIGEFTFGLILGPVFLVLQGASANKFNPLVFKYDAE